MCAFQPSSLPFIQLEPTKKLAKKILNRANLTSSHPSFQPLGLVACVSKPSILPTLKDFWMLFHFRFSITDYVIV